MAMFGSLAPWLDQATTRVGDALIKAQNPYGDISKITPEDRRAQIGTALLSLGGNIAAAGQRGVNPMAALGQGVNALQQQGIDNSTKLIYAQTYQNQLERQKRADEQSSKWQEWAKANAGKFGDYGQLLPFMEPKDGLTMLAELKKGQQPELKEIYDDQGRQQKVMMYSDGRYVPVGGPQAARNEGEGREFSQEDKLRKAFIDSNKAFGELRSSYQKVKTAAANPSPAGDLALVYSFMKMLDPGSVVRENEFATAENAGGVPERVRAMYNKALSGERLTPEIRQDFLNQTELMFDKTFGEYEASRKIYGDLASQYGLDPTRVAPDLSLGVTRPQFAGPKADMQQRNGVYNPATGRVEWQ